MYICCRFFLTPKWCVYICFRVFSHLSDVCMSVLWILLPYWRIHSEGMHQLRGWSRNTENVYFRTELRAERLRSDIQDAFWNQNHLDLLSVCIEYEERKVKVDTRAKSFLRVELHSCDGKCSSKTKSGRRRAGLRCGVWTCWALGPADTVYMEM